MPSSDTSPSPTSAPRRARRTLFLYKLLHRRVDAVRDVNVPLGAHGNEVGLAEFTDAGSRLSGRCENPSLQIQPEKLAGETVDHVDVLIADRQRARQTGVFHFPDELSVGIE